MGGLPVGDLSVGDCLIKGREMLQHGWEAEPAESGNGYVWRSPRGKEYETLSINLPTVAAVTDAIEHKEACNEPRPDSSGSRKAH